MERTSDPKPKDFCRNGHDLRLPEAVYVAKDKKGMPYPRCQECRRLNHHKRRRGVNTQVLTEPSYKDKLQHQKLLDRVGLDMPKDRWDTRALCYGDNTEIYFADWGEEEAKDVCRQCPVRLDCLAANLKEEYGIFGGLTPSERRRLINPRSIPKTPAPKQVRRKYIPSPATDRQIIDMYKQQGFSVLKISRELGVSRDRVRDVLNSHGVARGRRPEDPERVNRVVDLYAHGTSVAGIARELNITRDRVMVILNHHGGTLRRMEREYKILELLASGCTERETAKRTGVERNFVHNVKNRHRVARQRRRQQEEDEKQARRRKR